MRERSPRQHSDDSSGGSLRTAGGRHPKIDLQASAESAANPSGAHHSRESQILATLLWEMEQRVRNDLAEHLRRCPYLPPTLAATLANDVEQSAAPIGTRLTTPQSDTLSELFQAPGTDGSLFDTALDHAQLPLQVTDRLIVDLSMKLREGLIERHGLPSELADEIVMHGRERTLSQAITAAGPSADVDPLVVGLSARHALTPTLMLRSLCLGRLHFFATALAALADVPVVKSKALIFGDSVADLQKLYERSGLPLDLFRAFRTTVDLIAGLSPEQIDSWQREYTNRIIARLVNEYDHVCPEDLEHVMSQLTRRMNEQAASSGPLRAEGPADA